MYGIINIGLLALNLFMVLLVCLLYYSFLIVRKLPKGGGHIISWAQPRNAQRCYNRKYLHNLFKFRKKLLKVLYVTVIIVNVINYHILFLTFKVFN